MNIVCFRVDERLVHGQIVTKWLPEVQAKRLIVVDSEIAVDDFMKEVLQMALPPELDFAVISMDDARKRLMENDEIKTMVLVKTVETAAHLGEQLSMELEFSINVGNCGMQPGRTKITDTVYLNEQEIRALRQLRALGYPVFFQTLPDTKSVHFLGQE